MSAFFATILLSAKSPVLDFVDSLFVGIVALCFHYFPFVQFLAKTPQVEAETVQQAIRPLFLSLGDHRALSLQVIKVSF